MFSSLIRPLSINESRILPIFAKSSTVNELIPFSPVSLGNTLITSKSEVSAEDILAGSAVVMFAQKSEIMLSKAFVSSGGKDSSLKSASLTEVSTTFAIIGIIEESVVLKIFDSYNASKSPVIAEDKYSSFSGSLAIASKLDKSIVPSVNGIMCTITLPIESISALILTVSPLILTAEVWLNIATCKFLRPTAL